MYSQATVSWKRMSYVSERYSRDRVDWKLKLGKRGGHLPPWSPWLFGLNPRELWQGNCSPAGWEVGGRGGWWGQENNSPWSLVSEPLARDLGIGCISPWPHDHIAGGLWQGNYRWWKGVQPRIAPTGRGALEPHSTYLYGDPKNSSEARGKHQSCLP